MRRLSVGCAVVAALMVGITASDAAMARLAGPSPLTETATTLSTSNPATPNSDNDHMFTFGEIEIPSGEPGQLSVVLTGQLDESGHLPVVVRNNREQTMYDIGVLIIGTDTSGAEVATAEYFISTAGLEPGEWTFGQNAAAAPGLSEAANFQLQFSGSEEPVGFVELDVATAELIDDAIVGIVTNNSDSTLGNFNVVNVACFNGAQVSAYQLAMADAQTLGPGASASFSTTIPIDPTTCPAFAIYALGVATSDVGQVETDVSEAVVIKTLLPVTEESLVVTESSVVFDVEETIASLSETHGLEPALLTAEDLGDGWENEGSEVLEFGPTIEPFRFCPDGEELLVPVDGTNIWFTPSWTGESDSLADDDVTEAVLVFATAEDAGSWFDGFESCVGEKWEESSDPVEHVSFERFEAPDLGDESAGFHTVYAHSEGPEHDTHGVVVRFGEVLVIVDYNNAGLDEPIDQEFFDDLIETAVAKVAATLD
jgi:hypothetical protein